MAESAIFLWEGTDKQGKKAKGERAADDRAADQHEGHDHDHDHDQDHGRHGAARKAFQESGDQLVTAETPKHQAEQRGSDQDHEHHRGDPGRPVHNVFQRRKVQLSAGQGQQESFDRMFLLAGTGEQELRAPPNDVDPVSDEFAQNLLDIQLALLIDGGCYSRSGI